MHTVRNLHFLSKNSTLIYDFMRKLSILGVKNSWKCWDFVEIEFLDKYLTSRTVCLKRITIEFSRQKLSALILIFGAKIQTLQENIFFKITNKHLNLNFHAKMTWIVQIQTLEVNFALNLDFLNSWLAPLVNCKK